MILAPMRLDPKPLKMIGKASMKSLKSLNFKGVMTTLYILFLYLLLSEDLVWTCSFELA